MATSRRRERELARRRYERRRLREMQQRAKRRRRNTIIGGALGTAAVIGLVVFLAVHFTGSSSDQLTSAAKGSATPTASASASPPPPAPTKCAAIKPNPPDTADPKVPPVTGKAPTKLVVKDLKKGTGKPAKDGDTLTVNYVGVSCSTGKSFDASYPKGQPFTFPFGQGRVIQGWDKGMAGMRVGGRRELIIPASLGYGAAGSPPSIAPNETLIFVVDLLKVTPPS